MSNIQIKVLVSTKEICFECCSILMTDNPFLWDSAKMKLWEIKPELYCSNIKDGVIGHYRCGAALKKYSLQNPVKIKTTEHKQDKLLMDPK